MPPSRKQRVGHHPSRGAMPSRDCHLRERESSLMSKIVVVLRTASCGTRHRSVSRLTNQSIPTYRSQTLSKSCTRRPGHSSRELLVGQVAPVRGIAPHPASDALALEDERLPGVRMVVLVDRPRHRAGAEGPRPRTLPQLREQLSRSNGVERGVDWPGHAAILRASARPLLCVGSQREDPRSVCLRTFGGCGGRWSRGCCAPRRFLEEGDLEDRIRELKEDIARRLRPVLPTIPEEEFERLIDQMANIQFKYEAMEQDPIIRAPLPDPSASGP